MVDIIYNVQDSEDIIHNHPKKGEQKRKCTHAKGGHVIMEHIDESEPRYNSFWRKRVCLSEGDS
jgi:hypothetical protein